MRRKEALMEFLTDLAGMVPRRWEGLGEEEIKDFQVNRFVSERLIRSIEQRLKDKNTGPRSVAAGWQTLDDEEYQTILAQLGDGGLLAFYTLIEQKLKEKNGG
jgi:hypothetical protein